MRLDYLTGTWDWTAGLDICCNICDRQDKHVESAKKIDLDGLLHAVACIVFWKLHSGAFLVNWTYPAAIMAFTVSYSTVNLCN